MRPRPKSPAGCGSVSEADLDRLIARWAEGHAPDLIARAQAGAFEQACEQLRARLVDALIEAAAARMGATPRPEPEQPAPAVTDRPATTSDALLWVYGVVAARHAEPPEREGVDDRPVRLHRCAGMTALVSEVPREEFGKEALSARLEDLDALEALARAHEAVLQTAMEAGAVVPFRLCTLYSSAERLDAMLERERPKLAATLDRLDGMQEWGVKAFLRAPESVLAADAVASSATGTEYLSRKRERRDAVDATREATDAVVAGIHARLAESAAAAVLSRPHDRGLSGRDAEMVLNAAYLVPVGGVDAFRSTVETLGRRHDADGVELELTGPWPAHHFVETPEQ